ncbi:hypothetical protein ACJIZ3_002839 [Penstemon smallii]|uniref:Zinc finger PHD-type domain-containing protein n=1 Tax=Penstemon smallii TaxID=265156 RepID=A0ABD3U7L9_9LAMI
MMDTISVQCGDKGYPAALVYCVKCLAYPVHRYCLHVPKKSNEYVRWVCDDCEIKEQIDAVSKNIDGSSDFQTKKTTNMEVVKEESVFVDGLEQSYIAPTIVNGNEGSEQRDQITFSHLRSGRSHIEPCPSLTEHLIVTYDGSLRSSKKKETVFSSEAYLEQESHGTTSTQPLNENNGIELDNYRSEYSTEGRGIGPSSENKESEVKQERSSPPHHTSDLLKDTSNHSNREPILREQQASFSHKSDKHVHIQDNSGRWNHNISSDSGNDRSFEGKESHLNISNERSPCKSLRNNSIHSCTICHLDWFQCIKSMLRFQLINAMRMFSY